MSLVGIERQEDFSDLCEVFEELGNDLILVITQIRKRQ